MAGNYTYPERTPSFVRRKAERGYVYHEKVRELMLRHLHNTIPKDLDETHSRLADYFASEKAALNLEGESAYQSETWRRLEGERVYHILNAQPERNSHEAVNAFMHAFRWRWGFAEEIARSCQQCGQEKGLQTIRELAEVLSEIYRVYDQDEYQIGIEKLGSLERRNALTEIARCEIYALRGSMFWHDGKNEEALADFDRAIELDASYAWAIACRGLTYRATGRYEEALAEYQRVIELDLGDSTSRTGLAVCYRRLGLMDEYYRQIAIARELVAKEGDYDRACFAAICGENDDALALLRTALEKRKTPLAWVERDPDFDFLRGDPRFAALIEEMRARFAAGST